MSVCLYSVFVLSRVLVAALRRADPPSKESYRLCKKRSRNWNGGHDPIKVCRAIERERWRHEVCFISSLLQENTWNSEKSVCLCLYSPLLDLGRFFSVSWSFTRSVGLLGRGISPSQGRCLHTEQHKQNKRTQTSIPQVGFEPTIAVSERVKTGHHALDREATMIGTQKNQRV
jgi:hypothetical protein